MGVGSFYNHTHFCSITKPSNNLPKLSIKLNFWSTEEDNSLLTIVSLLLSAAASSSLLWHNYQLSITVSSPQSSSQCGSTRRCVAHVLQYTHSCRRPSLLNPIFPRSIIVGKKVFRSKVMSLASRHPLCYITYKDGPTGFDIWNQSVPYAVWEIPLWFQ